MWEEMMRKSRRLRWVAKSVLRSSLCMRLKAFRLRSWSSSIGRRSIPGRNAATRPDMHAIAGFDEDQLIVAFTFIHWASKLALPPSSCRHSRTQVPFFVEQVIPKPSSHGPGSQLSTLSNRCTNLHTT